MLDRTVLVLYNVIVADQYSSVNAFFEEGENMVVSKKKLEVAMATACLNPFDLCKAAEIRYQTYQRITSGKDAKPATIGKIAKALKTPVEQLIED